MRHLGIATHVAPYTDFDAIVDKLADGVEASEALAAYGALAEDAPIAAYENEVNRLFDGNSVEDILARLDVDAGQWAAQTAATIRTKSPTSLKIAFRQMLEGVALPFRECMRLEFRLTERIQQGHDFYEGVRATIVDKDGAPQWKPATLEDVTGEAIDAYFAPLEKEWTAL